jgi:plasmid stability protein
MPHVLVRDLSPAVIEKLKDRAREHDRSLQAELKNVLEETARTSVAQTRRAALRIRAKLRRRTHTDSAKLIAADRSR